MSTNDDDEASDVVIATENLRMVLLGEGVAKQFEEMRDALVKLWSAPERQQKAIQAADACDALFIEKSLDVIQVIHVCALLALKGHLQINNSHLSACVAAVTFAVHIALEAHKEHQNRITH